MQSFEVGWVAKIGRTHRAAASARAGDCSGWSTQLAPQEILRQLTRRGMEQRRIGVVCFALNPKDSRRSDLGTRKAPRKRSSNETSLDTIEGVLIRSRVQPLREARKTGLALQVLRVGWNRNAVHAERQRTSDVGPFRSKAPPARKARGVMQSVEQGCAIRAHKMEGTEIQGSAEAGASE